MRRPYLLPVATILPGIALSLSVSTSALAQTGDVARPPSEERLPGLVTTDGLFRMPTAYLQRDGELTFFTAGDKNASGGLLAGLGQRLELGVSAGDLDRGRDKFTGSAKVNLLPEALIAPAISAGVLDAFDATRDGRSGYVVVSKYVIPYFVEAVTGQKGYFPQTACGVWRRAVSETARSSARRSGATKGRWRSCRDRGGACQRRRALLPKRGRRDDRFAGHQARRRWAQLHDLFAVSRKQNENAGDA